MRTKTPAVKARPMLWPKLCSGFRYPSPPTISYPQEASGEDSFDCDVLKKSYDDLRYTGPIGAQKVPDSCGKSCVPSKKRKHPINEDVCFFCDKGDRHVLFCSGIGCPIAFHEQCVSSKLNDGEVRCFYCPYCWYKNQMARSKALREQTGEAEKMLSHFIDAELTGVNIEKQNIVEVGRQETGLPIDKFSNPGHLRDRMDIDGLTDLERLEKNRPIDSFPEFEVLENEERRAIEFSEDVKKGGHVDQRQKGVKQKKATDQFKISNDVEAKDLEEAKKNKLGGAAENQHRALGVQKAPNSSRRLGDKERIRTDRLRKADDILHVQRKKQMNRNEEANSFSSSASTNTHSQYDQGGCSVAMHLQQDHGKQIVRNEASARNVASKSSPFLLVTSSAGDRNCKEKPPKPSPEKSKPLTQRRRVNWTVEEYQMLQEGFEKFAPEANKKISWQSILNYGRHVFHETRRAIDLKDKWKNMHKKEVRA